jgi:hypothetical protein
VSQICFFDADANEKSILYSTRFVIQFSNITRFLLIKNKENLKPKYAFYHFKSIKTFEKLFKKLQAHTHKKIKSSGRMPRGLTFFFFGRSNGTAMPNFVKG